MRTTSAINDIEMGVTQQKVQGLFVSFVQTRYRKGSNEGVFGLLGTTRKTGETKNERWII